MFRIALPLFVLLVSCSSIPAASSSVTSTAITVTTGAFEVPPGADTFECFYTDRITDRELAATNATAVQMTGGHHLALYYTMTPRDVQHHRCTDEEMSTWEIVAVAGGEAGGGSDQSLPAGLATRIPAGAQLVVQAHYIAMTGTPASVSDTITVGLVDPSTIRAYANQFIMNDAGFTLDAHATVRATFVCHAPRDLDIVMYMGHMHRRGMQFTLEQLAGATDTGTVMYDEPWEESYATHPPVVHAPIDAPLHVASGQRFRQTCTWSNPDDTPVLFPTEMCITAMWYFPDMGSGQIFCERETATQTNL